LSYSKVTVRNWFYSVHPVRFPRPGSSSPRTIYEYLRNDTKRSVREHLQCSTSTGNRAPRVHPGLEFANAVGVTTQTNSLWYVILSPANAGSIVNWNVFPGVRYSPPGLPSGATSTTSHQAATRTSTKTGDCKIFMVSNTYLCYFACLPKWRVGTAKSPRNPPGRKSIHSRSKQSEKHDESSAISLDTLAMPEFCDG
jgi:hypothetical protein